MIVERPEIRAKPNRYRPTEAAIHLDEGAGHGFDCERRPCFYSRAAALVRRRMLARFAARLS